MALSCVLIVDDDPDAREVLTDIVEGLGWKREQQKAVFRRWQWPVKAPWLLDC